MQLRAAVFVDADAGAAALLQSPSCPTTSHHRPLPPLYNISPQATRTCSTSWWTYLRMLLPHSTCLALYSSCRWGGLCASSAESRAASLPPHQPPPPQNPESPPPSSSPRSTPRPQGLDTDEPALLDTNGRVLLRGRHQDTLGSVLIMALGAAADPGSQQPAAAPSSGGPSGGQGSQRDAAPPAAAAGTSAGERQQQQQQQQQQAARATRYLCHLEKKIVFSTPPAAAAAAGDGAAS